MQALNQRRPGIKRPEATAGSTKTASPTAGLTLLEVIVSLSLAVILITLAGSMIVFGMNFLNRSETRASDKQLAEQSADFVKERLLYAHSIEVVSVSPGSTPPAQANLPPGATILFIGQEDAGGTVVISNEGHLYYQRSTDTTPIDAFGEGSYRNNSLTLAYSALVDTENSMRTQKSFEISCTTIRDGSAVFSSKKTFNLYNATNTRTEPRQSASVDSGSETFYLLIDAPSEEY